MATEWEYRRVRALAAEAADQASDIRGLVEARWSEKLKEAGATGWELVTETRDAGGSSELGNWWIELSGTLKRPGSPL